MKKSLVILIFSVCCLGASAQHGHIGGGYYYRPRLIIGVGAYMPFFPYFGYGYNPFYPYPGYGYRPSKLTMKIDGIKADYRDKIHSAKTNADLTHQQKKEVVRALKHQRDQAIDDLKRNYYKY